eukprot:8021686-Prorocentrum_lima.AAC.1
MAGCDVRHGKGQNYKRVSNRHSNKGCRLDYVLLGMILHKVLVMILWIVGYSYNGRGLHRMVLGKIPYE